MLNISNKMKNHLNEEVTTLATCWKVILANGAMLGFTDFDHDILFDKVKYLASTGFTASSIENSSNIKEEHFQVESMIDSSKISKKDILSGLFDYAKIEIFLVNYKDLTMGRIPLKFGNIGKIKILNNKFTAEISGIKEKLNWQIGEVFSGFCRAKFGDNRCKVDLKKYSYNSKINKTIDIRTYECDLPNILENNFFEGGILQFQKAEQVYEISDYKNSIITIKFAPSFIPKEGDKIIITAGCNKKFKTCCEKFNNAINFRGEPHIPGSTIL